MNAAGTRKAVFLNPGDLYFGKGPARVATVLGSCVSVILRNPHDCYAAMCHCLLPRWKKTGMPLPADPELRRYVDTCIPLMLKMLEKHGGLDSIEAKVFGGAYMFTSRNGVCVRHVGAENTAVALELLQRRSLPVASSDIGGNYGRKILFYTDTGEVRVRRLNSDQRGTA